MFSSRFKVLVEQPVTRSTPLISDAFLCSMTPAGLRLMHLAVGDQIRIETLRKSEYVLYSVIETPTDEVSDEIVRMGSRGMARVGAAKGFSGILDTTITRSGLSDEDASNESEFVERLDETNATHRGVVVCAPHGGMIEEFTDLQAEYVLTVLRNLGKDVSCWRCKGWRQHKGAYDRWHITSTLISPRSFPLLGQIHQRKFQYALSFHGYAGQSIKIGGAAPASLKQEIAAELRASPACTWAVDIASSASAYSGDSQKNFVNWLTAPGCGGLQIEQPKDAREQAHSQIAEAVARVLARHL